jgi:hypothetical protein
MKSKTFAAYLVAFYVSLAIGNLARADDDAASLKREIDSLRREVDLLKRERDKYKKELDQLKATMSTSDNNPKESGSSKSPEGEINGIVWEIDILNDDGSVNKSIKFLAAEGKIYHDFREVGHYSEKGNRCRIDITNSLAANANGFGELLRTSNNPPLYHGRFKNKAGVEAKVRLRIVKD